MFFLTDTMTPLYSKHLEDWHTSIHEQISKLDPTKKDEIEKILSVTASPEELSADIDISDQTIQQILSEMQLRNKIEKKLFLTIREMSLIYLVTQFEEFLKDCMKLIYEKQPLALKLTHKMIDSEELVDTKNHEEVMQVVINKIVEEVIENGIEEISSYMKKLNIDLTSDEQWNNFKECFYRRNVLVHNNGYANKKYHSKMCTTFEKKRLDVTDTYFAESLKLFDYFSHKIAHSLDKKFFPDKYFGIGGSHDFLERDETAE